MLAPALALLLAPALAGAQQPPLEPVSELDAPAARVPVLHSGIGIEIEAMGDLRYEGAFSGMDEQMLLLSTREGVLEIPMPVVLNVLVEGDPYAPDAFIEGVRRWGQEMIDQAVRTPRPVLVGGLSVVWAGAGPAALGQWKSAAAYSLLEVSFIGAGAVMIANEQYGPLLPLGALDALLHVWAVSDSVRESRRRRSRAQLAVLPRLALSDHAEPELGVGLVLRIGGPATPATHTALPWALASGEPGLTGACSLP
jgi:hypothetical protein